MRISEAWISAPETRAVCAALTDAGYQALFVGGCVRNALLGAPVSDLDIATDARPEQVMDVVRAAGLAAVPTGIDHGTVTVVSNHVPHEVTTFRRDVETDGRRAVVAYADGPEADAHRRDFTMNALYARPDGQIIDPLGGLADLQARRVRFIDDAEMRIREDYLRILRFFRFHAWYGDPQAGLDADGLAACAAFSAGIETLSRERLGAEMKKLLSAPDPGPSVAAMAQAGVLARVLPGADARALPVLLHLEEGVAPDAIRRLAVLSGQDVAAALRLSRDEAARHERLREAIGSADGPGALGYRLGTDEARDALMLRGALFEQPLPQGWQAAVAQGAAAEFPIKAADLMPALQGPALGARLRLLEQRWIASGFALGRDELLGITE
ncbi:CCA tRNA nucleotidyltransferase [Actibacterium sp. XHP0104]|uniref:CCA tRNA nucleotidyltransferase n=1 Tax=Actibacterium sp. XHP0104 TaxID=2984335 RepID=UPI0021E7EFA4|nr:CCA tRNA nucleotidyltransferase [Actibacterium sp. XHP0104]MCV2882080.1 CCA tRNA nucleotidyltransferase [Actibacterium sp. XHP0104]